MGILLVVVAATVYVQGQEATSLEEWCKDRGHTWDDGTCTVGGDDWNKYGCEDLYIEAEESLIILETFL